jgi:hypothetical protein
MARKPTPRAKRPDKVVERNINLIGNVMHYLLDRPQVLNSLPDKFELVILPDDDPELRHYNLELLDVYGREGKPIVFARLRSSEATNLKNARLNFYIPLAA